MHNNPGASVNTVIRFDLLFFCSVPTLAVKNHTGMIDLKIINPIFVYFPHPLFSLLLHVSWPGSVERLRGTSALLC